MEGMTMYKSPIEIICGDIQKKIDNDIYSVTQKYDIRVDKNELIQALAYDRDQYKKGYIDGKRDAMADLVRCKDCENTCTGSNGLVCIIWGSGTELDAFCSYGERKDNERKAD
jgi:hypothetical protein